MKRVFGESSSRQAAALGIAVLVAALAVTGCGRNEGALPSGYVPEGIEGEESFLFVSLDSVSGNSVSPAGPAVTITVIDRTTADGYQIYRRNEGDDAFSDAVDYAGPFQSTFNQGVQYFQVLDRDWEENRAVEYVGRGTILGNETEVSPLSTVGGVPAGTFADLAVRPFNQIAPVFESLVDSELNWMLYCLPVEVDPGCDNPVFETINNEFSWEAVPGAVRYLLQVIRTDGVQSLVVLTPPDGSPTFNVASLDGLILQELVPFSPGTFFWTVLALDANSRVIAATPYVWLFGVFDPNAENAKLRPPLSGDGSTPGKDQVPDGLIGWK